MGNYINAVFFPIAEVVLTLLGETEGSYQRLKNSTLFWKNVRRCANPIAPPRPRNISKQQHLGAAEPAMTQASGIFATGPRFVCTSGLARA